VPSLATTIFFFAAALRISSIIPSMIASRLPMGVSLYSASEDSRIFWKGIRDLVWLPISLPISAMISDDGGWKSGDVADRGPDAIANKLLGIIRNSIRAILFYLFNRFGDTENTSNISTW